VPRSDSQRFYNSSTSDVLTNIVVYAGPHGVYVLRRIGGMPCHLPHIRVQGCHANTEAVNDTKIGSTEVPCHDI